MNAEEVLKMLVDWVLRAIKELFEERDKEGDFQYGERTAFTECLELIRMWWEHAAENGLDFDIEKRFPLWPKK